MSFFGENDINSNVYVLVIRIITIPYYRKYLVGDLLNKMRVTEKRKLFKFISESSYPLI